ncbi:hypothetical protein EJ04DRAFT_561651 [Polyplosphaeria fusca]|uniref:Uncharacterized protein n=1 Tax=Polyplosphaeria fusca TaxID=682080 RepID=A0A9P4R674_9PLEO|nr:hypothetical protein EJ04DRAFT_561651 [Polyplosphaeria fusca]
MSTDVLTNSEWKTNFWLSTTGSDGQPTDVPVVHCGCICRGTCDDDDDDDDSAFIWVIFWGVPKLPSVQFAFPKLPDFHIPTCINILGIKLGDCPPESDNGNHGHSDSDDPKNKNQPPEDEPKPSSGQQSSAQSTDASSASTTEESSSSSSSSSSSCSASAVTDFHSAVSCPSASASSEQCSTVIQSSVRTGCDITGTATGTMTNGAPSCPLLTYVGEGPGVGYSEPGFSYGTYAPPTFTDGPTTTNNATTSAQPGSTGGQATSTGEATAPPTTLSTVTVSDDTSSAASATTDASQSATDSASNSDAPSSSSEEASSDTPTPTPTPTPPPQPDQGRKCSGVDNKVWMGRDAMADAIDKFCADAGSQGGHDKDSGNIMREYNADSPDHIVLSIDWPQEVDFKADEKSCHDHMYDIMEDCDGNDPANPMNWKHGGTKGVDWTVYNLTPKTEKYQPGVCHYHVHEIEEWEGVDSPGFSRKWWFYLQVELNDANGDKVGGTGDDHVEAGDTFPLKVPGYYQELSMTPEAQGGDYIQFNMGSAAWTTKDEHETDDDKNVVPGCNVGGFDGDYSPAGRDMDCWIQC